MAAGEVPGKPPLAFYLDRNCGLFRGLFGSPHTLRQRSREIGHRSDGFGRGAAFGIKAGPQGIDQRGTDHRTVGILRDAAGGFRSADAEADTARQPRMPLAAPDRPAPPGPLAPRAPRTA